MSALTVNQALGQVRWFTPQQIDDDRTQRIIEETLAARRRHGRKSKPVTQKKARTP